MTHWKKLTNPNYIGAYSIEDGKDLILTIDYVREETVIGADGKKDNCVVCHFKENSKPMILNSTNMKSITKLYKTPFIEDWQGKKIQIGIEKVKAFGEVVEALRVRNIVPKSSTSKKILCDCCGEEITPMGGRTAEELAKYTKDKYGVKLCAKCATATANVGNEDADNTTAEKTN